MSPRIPLCASPSALPYQELWRTEIQRWLHRLPRGRALGSPEDILTGLQGALWLDCLGLELDDAMARRVLRRVLYHEYEVAWQHRPLSLEDVLPYLEDSNVDSVELELPPHAHSIARAYLHGRGCEGSLRRAMPHFGSRRMVRSLNTLLLEVITEGEPLQNLKRRAARCLAASARDGITKAHVQEARYIQRALRMLEPNVEIRKLQDCLKGISSGN